MGLTMKLGASWARRAGFSSAVALLLMSALSASTKAQYKTEIVPIFPHLASIEAIAVSPNGTLILSGSWDGGLKLWERTTGRLIREFAGHVENKLTVPRDQPVTLSSKITSLAFSPDSLRAVSGSQDSTLKHWDLTTGELLQIFSGQMGSVTSVDFSPDGASVVSGSSDKIVRLWNPMTGALVRSFAGHDEEVTSVKFIVGGKVLSASKDTKLKLWDAASGKLLRTINTKGKAITDTAVSPDGALLVTAAQDENVIKLWSAKTGRIVRTFVGSSNWLDLITFARSGKNLISVSSDGISETWDTESGELVRTLKMPFPSASSVVALSPDEHLFVSGGADYVLKVWDAISGQPVNTFADPAKKITSVGVSTDGTRIVAGSWDLTIKFWDAASGRLIRNFVGHSSSVTSVAVSADASRVLSGSWDKTIKLWDGVTGENIQTFEGHSQFVTSVAFSPDAKSVLSGSWDKTVRLWDARTGRLLRILQGHSGPIESVAFSPEGGRAVSGDQNGTVLIWNLSTGQSLKSLAGHRGGVLSVAFSPGGDRVLTGGADALVKLWSAESGELLQTCKGHFYSVNSVAFLLDGNKIVSGSWDGSLKIWDATTGSITSTVQGNLAAVNSVASLPDGVRMLSGSADGTTRIWDIKTGSPISVLVGTVSNGGLSMTPEGFFNASSPDAAPLLSIVRGLDAYGVDQLWQSLYSPDLVREKLAGDPDGEVKRAAAVTNLDKLLDSGRAPKITVKTLLADAKSSDEIIIAEAKIAEQDDGGIGRIEWRVNGITAGVSYPANEAPTVEVSQVLALDQGDNIIEVVAYNGRNSLASVPARVSFNFAGSLTSVKPKLHILAIGINTYVDRGWTPPGETGPVQFPPLSLAVDDATALSEAFRKGGARQYSEVSVTRVLDGDATLDGLERAINQLAAQTHPRDTFVLFAAAHGISEGGRFYLIPQDFQGGPGALAEKAVGQARLQDWIANRIKAKRALILLDTCESGAVVGGHTRSRTDVPDSEAAIGRLHEATGRPVLTAAAEGKPAFEGFEGHGVFTWTLLDALKNGDRNANGTIELSELVAHVQDQVPRISAKLDGRGRAAIAARGSPDDRQSARFGSRGEDFSIVRVSP